MRCTRAIGGVIASSPVAVNPDGTGLVVYFGDNGLNGFDDGGHLWAVNGVDPNAAANCSREVVVQRLRRHARQPARRRHVVAAGLRQGQERPARS